MFCRFEWQSKICSGNSAIRHLWQNRILPWYGLASVVMRCPSSAVHHALTSSKELLCQSLLNICRVGRQKLSILWPPPPPISRGNNFWVISVTLMFFFRIFCTLGHRSDRLSIYRKDYKMNGLSKLLISWPLEQGLLYLGVIIKCIIALKIFFTTAKYRS